MYGISVCNHIILGGGHTHTHTKYPHHPHHLAGVEIDIGQCNDDVSE